MLAHRATADVALLKLAAPLSMRPAPLLPVARRASRPARNSWSTAMASAVAAKATAPAACAKRRSIATGQPGNLQLRLVDPKTGGTAPGLGACTGNSGSPVYQETPSGLAIYGVMSWSTGANNEGGCGGLTGVTPLELYRRWIEEQAAIMGSALPAIEAPQPLSI